MNKRNIRIILIIILSVMLILKGSPSFAGMADFDDNAAAEQTQNMLQEQEKEEQEVVGKSTNNYLSELEVNGYSITPKFDKQIQEYSITEEIDEEEIYITAVTDDSRATVEGKGKIILQPGENNLRIDVEAESGTVRTYFIKINRTVNKSNENIEQNENVENSINIINDEVKNTVTNITTDTNTELEQNNDNIISVFIILIIIIVLYLLLKKPKKKKKNHRK